MAGLRIIFMGTPAFACPTLTALAGAGHEIVAVYTQPPRPAGRGKKPRPSPVQELAEQIGAPVRTPKRLKDPADQADFAELNADLAVVVAYGLILPQAVLDAPRLGCLNLHASLLPRWRGAAPIQRALMAGDAETGVCVMQMSLGLDEGPVLARQAIPIGPEDTGATLHDRLSEIGAPLMLGTVDALAAGPVRETPQPEDGVTYAAKIDKAEARVDWSRPAAEVDRLIRGLSPFPGAWTPRAPAREGGEPERLKLLFSSLSPASCAGAVPGEAVDDALTIACGDGRAVRIERLQRAGKGAVTAEEFQRGRPIRKGARMMEAP